MTQTSGMFQAGKILLLIGAILAAAGTLLMVLLAIGIDVLFEALDESDPSATWIPWFYGGLAIIMAAGAVFGFIAYRKAQKGDAQGAFVFGLIAALVPPLQVVPLLGAIFCKVSPEGSG